MKGYIVTIEYLDGTRKSFRVLAENIERHLEVLRMAGLKIIAVEEVDGGPGNEVN
jgi:hypothetical protein